MRSKTSMPVPPSTRGAHWLERHAPTDQIKTLRLIIRSACCSEETGVQTDVHWMERRCGHVICDVRAMG